MDNGENSYRRYIAGDDSGLAQIIKEYKDGLTLYINGYVNNVFVAEELMEETFFKLATKKPRFMGKSSFKTWLFAIARNTALDYLRNKVKIFSENIDDCDFLLTEENSVESDYLKKEQNIILHRAMRRLKPEYFQVLYLIFLEDFTNEQAALIMKKNKRQIENLIYRAKGALKSEILKEGYGFEEL